MISDSINEVKDRISAPFWGAFLISWCLWNIDVVLNLGSTIGWEDKSHYFLKQMSWRKYVWFPLMSSILVTLIGHALKEGLTYAIKLMTLFREGKTLKLEVKMEASSVELPIKMALVSALISKHLGEMAAAIKSTVPKEGSELKASFNNINAVTNELMSQLDRNHLVRNQPNQFTDVTKSLNSCRHHIDSMNTAIGAMVAKMSEIEEVLKRSAHLAEMNRSISFMSINRTVEAIPKSEVDRIKIAIKHGDKEAIFAK